MPSLAFSLFHLNFIFITISMFPLPIPRLIKLHIGSLSVKLDILRLLLTNYHWGFQMTMNQNDELVIARLEEEVLDVGEEHIDTLVAH